MLEPKKKPGLTVAIGIGKPKPSPMKGGPLAALMAGKSIGKPPSAPEEEIGDLPDEAGAEAGGGMTARLDAIEAKLDQIITALGLDAEKTPKEEAPEDAGEGADEEEMGEKAG